MSEAIFHGIYIAFLIPRDVSADSFGRVKEHERGAGTSRFD